MKVLFLTILTGLITVSAEEAIVLRRPIPNRLLKQGEARLTRDENGSRIRIDLNTRHLARVERKILAGEKQNWPESADSRRFQDALTQACRTAASAEGKVPFLIEWSFTPETTGSVRLKWTGGETILDDLDPAYIRENMILILMDQFSLKRANAEKTLFPEY